MRNIIPEFTKDEIEILRDKANFTEREWMLLCLRNKEYSLETCAEMMNYSVRTISSINKSMISKIEKVTVDVC